MALEDASKTILSYDSSDAFAAPVTIGELLGEIPLPQIQAAISKIRTNSAENPHLHVGDDEVPDVEITVLYTGHAVFATLSGLRKVEKYFRFTLDGGDTYDFYGMIADLAPGAGATEGALHMTLRLVFSHFVASTAAA